MVGAARDKAQADPRDVSWRATLGALAALMSLVTAGCQDSSQGEPSSVPQYMPTATIKDLMQSIVDGSADVVWLAVTDVHTAEGILSTFWYPNEEAPPPPELIEQSSLSQGPLGIRTNAPGLSAAARYNIPFGVH